MTYTETTADHDCRHCVRTRPRSVEAGLQASLVTSYAAPCFNDEMWLGTVKSVTNDETANMARDITRFAIDVAKLAEIRIVIPAKTNKIRLASKLTGALCLVSKCFII